MEELIKYIAQELVGASDIIVESEEGENGETNIKLYVEKSDIGKVIGKQGRIAKAIRTIVKAAAIKQNIRCNLEILEK